MGLLPFDDDESETSFCSLASSFRGPSMTLHEVHTGPNSRLIMLVQVARHGEASRALAAGTPEAFQAESGTE